MYRIILVDDEPLILSGISSLIPWEDYNCSIVGKATNGVLAFKLIQDLKPDIIITDIKMPVMNGLELIEKCKEEGLQFSFIILTNLEEFELAKKAISFGAADYLIKLEITDELLIKSLDKAKELYDKLTVNSTRKDEPVLSREDLTKTFFSKLMSSSNASLESYSFTTHEIEIAKNFSTSALMMLKISYFSNDYGKDNIHNGEKSIMAMVINIIYEMMGRFFKYYCVLPWDDQRFLLIISTQNINSLSDHLISFSKKLISVFKTYFEAFLCIGVSEVAENVYDLPELVPQTITALNHYYYSSSSPIIFYSERYSEIEHTDNFDINFLKKDITIALQQNDSSALKKIFDEIIDIITTYTPKRKQVINACINLYTFISSHYGKEEISITDIFTFPDTLSLVKYLNQLNSANDMVSFLRDFESRICTLLDSKKNSNTNKAISLIKQYINEHYNEKLSLSSIASNLNFSTGYISSIFRKHTGYSFSAYVSLVKVEKAKELINTHNYLMYEISEMVGFENPYYFSKVFKKTTGMSPREYELSVLKK